MPRKKKTEKVEASDIADGSKGVDEKDILSDEDEESNSSESDDSNSSDTESTISVSSNEYYMVSINNRHTYISLTRDQISKRLSQSATRIIYTDDNTYNHLIKTFPNYTLKLAVR